MADKAPLEYASALPGEPHSRRIRFSFSLFCAAAVPLWSLTAVLVFVVPRFKVVFGNFNVALPMLTRLVLGASDLILRSWGWAPLILLPLVPALALPQVSIKRRWLRLAITLSIGVILAITAIAMMLPMISLIDALTSANGK